MVEEYDFKAVEKKWQERWEAEKVFEVTEDEDRKKFYVLEMYPYPSGSGLHMGHAFNYTIGDILARFKRMHGFNVLHPMGFDSFGLPAENAAIKENSHPKIFTDAAIVNFIRQQKSLGLSYDWTRRLQSHDPNYYKWNQFIFLQLYKKGLVYRKQASVNWCPKCNTVLANEQVHDGKCWRHGDTEIEVKNLEQWFIKTTAYAEELLADIDKLDWPERIKSMQKNWIGRSEGSEIMFGIEKRNVSNCVIVHGSNESEKEALTGKAENLRWWKPWLKKSLEARGIKTSNELYPKDWAPDYSAWKKIFEKNNIDENTTLVGHSAGTAFILRWLSENKRKVAKVILVAPSLTKSEKYKNLAFKDFEYGPELNNYVNEITVIYSDDDDKDIIWSAKEIHRKLGGNLLMLKGRGHFCGENNTEEFPELLEQILYENWPVFTTRADTLMGVTFLVIAAQHPRLMELVSSEQKKAVQDFVKKIKSTSEKDAIELEKEGVFTGAYAKHPISGEKIPVWAGNFVVADYGSGMVMAVPAHDQRDFDFAKKYKIPIKEVIKPEGKKEDKPLKKAYVEAGVLINSGVFDGLVSEEAKMHIVKALEEKKLGRFVTQYKLRDWLISRQRYWGTPIPMIHCSKCGIVPVSEKEIPILLPEKVTFGKGNPLTTNGDFVNVSCPKCKGKAKRETDTMDTFFDSSWYYLRFTDAGNKKEPFDKKKAEYWMPVDFYTGGAEHACMHLIYARFFTKALRDIGYLNFGEPFTRLFNQGMVHGEDGAVMAKSRGNVVDPLTVSDQYGTDALRFFLVSIASPDKDFAWSSTGIQSCAKLINKIYQYTTSVKVGKSSAKVQHKINLTLRGMTNDFEYIAYNLAVIKLRSLFDSLESEISKKDLEKVICMIAPFCPHIAEELWEKTGHKEMIANASWPEVDEKSIDEKYEQMEKAFETTIADISNLVKIMKEKGKEVTKVYLYTIPPEKEVYNPVSLSERTGKEVKVFAVNDVKKYDPQNKAGKAKPGRPAIYME